MGKVYDDLAMLVRHAGLQERMALGLVEAAFGGRVRNASYRVSTDTSNNLASRDLKQLVDAGFLVPNGEKRGRHYVASDEVRAIRTARRLRKGNDDPFAESLSSVMQGRLF